jgi:hypothetical protein
MHDRIRNWKFLLFALLASSLIPASARAGFVISLGSLAPPGSDLVQLNTGDVGLAIMGEAQLIGQTVVFSSATQFLAAPAEGEARLEARLANDVNSSQVSVSDPLGVSLLNSDSGFTALGFSLFADRAHGSRGLLEITVQGHDPFGNAITEVFGTDDSGHLLRFFLGSNRFTVLTSEGDVIDSITIRPISGAFTDIRQVQIFGGSGGTGTRGTLSTPEPASLVLCGLGMSGMALIGLSRRRRGRSEA